MVAVETLPGTGLQEAACACASRGQASPHFTEEKAESRLQSL